MNQQNKDDLIAIIIFIAMIFISCVFYNLMMY
jgi:hypothetical protein